MDLQRAMEWMDDHRERFVEELRDFLRIPSVSTDPKQAPEVCRAADWLVARLHGLGFESRRFETEGHPVVFAQRCPHRQRPDAAGLRPTMTFSPRSPQRVGLPPLCPHCAGRVPLRPRGQRRQGQLFTYVKALEALLETEGSSHQRQVPPGGERRSAAPIWAPSFVSTRPPGRDAVAISDGSQMKAGLPAITYGLRGLAYLQLDVQGSPIRPSFRGLGGLIANPLRPWPRSWSASRGRTAAWPSRALRRCGAAGGPGAGGDGEPAPGRGGPEGLPGRGGVTGRRGRLSPHGAQDGPPHPGRQWHLGGFSGRAPRPSSLPEQEPR